MVCKANVIAQFRRCITVFVQKNDPETHQPGSCTVLRVWHPPTSAVLCGKNGVGAPILCLLQGTLWKPRRRYNHWRAFELVGRFWASLSIVQNANYLTNRICYFARNFTRPILWVSSDTPGWTATSDETYVGIYTALPYLWESLAKAMWATRWRWPSLNCNDWVVTCGRLVMGWCPAASPMESGATG